MRKDVMWIMMGVLVLRQKDQNRQAPFLLARNSCPMFCMALANDQSAPPGFPLDSNPPFYPCFNLQGEVVPGPPWSLWQSQFAHHTAHILLCNPPRLMHLVQSAVTLHSTSKIGQHDGSSATGMWCNSFSRPCVEITNARSFDKQHHLAPPSKLAMPLLQK